MTAMLLLLALAMVLGCRYLSRNRQPRQRALKVACRAGLTQKAGLALVTVSGRSLLIGYGEGAPALLLELEPSVASGACSPAAPPQEASEHVETRGGHRITLPDRFRTLLGEALTGAAGAPRKEMSAEPHLPATQEQGSEPRETLS